MPTSWTLRVEDARIQNPTFALQLKDGCYISANTKLVALDKAVCLSSESLATMFRDAILDTMRQRHGEAVTLLVASVTSDHETSDDALVLARIEQKMFAPNKRPVMRDESDPLGDLEKEVLDLLHQCDEDGKTMVLIAARVAAASSTEKAARPKAEVIPLF